MKKINLAAIILLTLSLIVPGTFGFAAQKKNIENSQVQLELININTADEASLTSVPGIGPKTAQSIVDYRQKNGKFAKLEDLTEVKGIGKKSLQKYKRYLTL